MILGHPPLRARWQALALGGVMIALLVEINALPLLPVNLYGLDWLWHTSHHLQIALLVAGAALLVYGLDGFPSYRGVTYTLRWLRLRWRSRYTRALIVVTLLALLLRLWNLEYGVHNFIDELLYVNAVGRLWDEPNTRILVPFDIFAAFTWLLPYAQSWSVGVFGANLTALRLPSVVLGILTIPALYLLARTLFDRQTGLLAALLLATFPPHIHFSRLGIVNVADPFFGVLALALLARGLQTGRRADFVWAGVSLALTHYFYEGGRLLYTPLIIGWLVILGLLSRRGLMQWRPVALRREFLAFGFIALVLTLPVYYTLLAQVGTIAPRLDSMGQSLLDSPGGLLDAWINRLNDPLRALLQLPDSGWFYGGETALILPVLLPLFLLGAGRALWRWRTPGGTLLLLWLIAVIVGNSLLVDRLATPRYVVLFPALALLLALGLRVLFSFQHHLRNSILIALTLVVAMYQVVYYFGTHLPGYYESALTITLNNIVVGDTDDVLFRLRDLPPESDVLIISRQLRLLPPDIEAAQRFYGRDDLSIRSLLSAEVSTTRLVNLPRDRTLAFFAEGADLETLDLLHLYFPSGTTSTSPYNIPPEREYLLYTVAPDQPGA